MISIIKADRTDSLEERVQSTRNETRRDESSRADRNGLRGGGRGCAGMARHGTAHTPGMPITASQCVIGPPMPAQSPSLPLSLPLPIPLPLPHDFFLTLLLQ